MIELRLLRYFVVVAETEHVGRAAERLHISQSPLSRQIRQLEGTLGVALFERIGRQIKLTPAGRRMLEPARDLLARAEAFERDSHEAVAPRLTIGFVGTALHTGVLPSALRVLRERYPAVEIALRHANSDAQLALLREDQIDVAYVHASPNARGLIVKRVLDQPYSLVIAKSSPLAKRALTVDALTAEPWIAVQTSNRERWLLACAAAGFTPRIAVEVADFASAIALVDAGMGVALLPDSQRAVAPSRLVFRSVPFLRLRSELWAVRRAHASPIAVDLVKLSS